jgi:tRNA (guanine-N7-)-methyltransferase
VNVNRDDERSARGSQGPQINRPDTDFGELRTAVDEPRRKRIEREYGVPFPGEILPREQWTSTALKKLPAAGPLEWQHVFARPAPVVLDLGCGNGRYLIGSALWRPQYDHLGIDALPVVIRYATRRANQRGLRNIRLAVAGGKELLHQYVVPGSVTEIHCYHPQPYYEPEEFSKRLITPEFLWLVWRSLVPGGLFVLQTDNPAYAAYMCQVVPAFFRLTVQKERWPDAPKGRTRREIVALRRHLPVFRATALARTDLDDREGQHLAGSLPQPTFDAAR